MNHSASGEPAHARRLLLLVAFVVLLGGCSGRERQQPPAQVAKVSVARPLVTPIVEWDEYTGRLAAIDSVEIRARVSGYLKSTHFGEGQLVNAGDLLAIIDPRPFEEALAAAVAGEAEAVARQTEMQAMFSQAVAERAVADAQLTLATQRVERIRELGGTDVVSQEEIDARESEVLQARAAMQAANAQIESARAGIATAKAGIETSKALVRAAELDLDFTQIRAPIDGRISRRYVTEGNLISGGSETSSLITTIVSTDPIHCYFDADEQAFLKYNRLSREGKRESSRDVKNPVFMRLADETGFPHQGHMDFVDNQIDPNTGTMRGRAIFPNDDNTLTPGLFAEVRLPGSGRYEAVLIPDSAVGSDQSEKFVYVVNDESTIERRKVELGPIVKGLRVIRGGLDDSPLIVTSGLQRIYPGARVEAREGEAIVAGDSPLPDDYQQVTIENSLSRKPAAAPEGIPANAAE